MTTTTTTTDAQAERDALAALRASVRIRAQVRPLKAQQEAEDAHLRAYLEASVFRALPDPETGASAILEERQGQPELDLAAISDADIITVARAGLLREVSTAAANAICAHNPRIADIRKKYEMPGRPTTALKVTEGGAK